MGPDGKLWFAEAGGDRIVRREGDGSMSEFPVPTPNSGPAFMATGPDGALWFTEGRASQIGRVRIDGVITESNLAHPLSGPAMICRGPNQDLWFSEYQGSRLGHIMFPTPVPDLSRYAGYGLIALLATAGAVLGGSRR